MKRSFTTRRLCAAATIAAAASIALTSAPSAQAKDLSPQEVAAALNAFTTLVDATNGGKDFDPKNIDSADLKTLANTASTLSAGSSKPTASSKSSQSSGTNEEVVDPLSQLSSNPNLSKAAVNLLNNKTLGSVHSLDDVDGNVINEVLRELNRSGLFGKVDSIDDVVPTNMMTTEHTTLSNGKELYFPTSGRLTSPFGPRWGAFHYGIDIANAEGTPIVAVMDGEVINSGPARGFGQWIRIKHDDGSISVYGHMSTLDVSVGDHVKAGQKIAGIGSLGQSTGPHLHFEIHPSGNGDPSGAVDPINWYAQNGIYVKQ